MEEIEVVVIDVPDPKEVLEEREFGITRAGGENVASDELQNFMKKKLDEVLGEPFKARPVTIFRVPAWFRESNRDLCEPKAVSIGPYHHGKETLRAMEEHKWSTLRDFLARNTDVGFEVYLREMRLLEAQARECYSETVDMGSNDFVMMLLLDGCFILEYLLKIESEQRDAVVSAIWTESDIVCDFCLLENQMPFFVIHMLLTIQGRCSQNCEVFCPLLELIYETKPLPELLSYYRRPQISCSEIQHLLHLYYRSMLPEREREGSDLVTGKSSSPVSEKSRDAESLRADDRSMPPEREREGSDLVTGKSSSPVSDKSRDAESRRTDERNIQCATKLHEAGVKFKKKSTPRDMFDVSFQNGTIEIPYFEIDRDVTIFLWNMVALEQCQQYEFENTLTSYFGGFMDSLISTEKDVAVLDQSGVIRNYLRNDEAAATFFNQFNELFGLDYSHHYFYDLFKDVNKYSESTWHKYRARLMHDYFSNPWSSISVVAAAILLILTVLQTYYSAAK